jgi:hypothetical protein
VKMAKSMLKGKNLLICDEAIHTIVYMLNRCPTKVVRNIKHEKEYSMEWWEAMTKSSKNLWLLCICMWAKKTKTRPTKNTSFKYREESKAIRLFDLEKKYIIVSKDVAFDEDHKQEESNQIVVPWLIEGKYDTKVIEKGKEGHPKHEDKTNPTSSTKEDASSQCKQ